MSQQTVNGHTALHKYVDELVDRGLKTGFFGIHVFVSVSGGQKRVVHVQAGEVRQFVVRHDEIPSGD